jgi:hypothetical protein
MGHDRFCNLSGKIRQRACLSICFGTFNGALI